MTRAEKIEAALNAMLAGAHEVHAETADEDTDKRFAAESRLASEYRRGLEDAARDMDAIAKGFGAASESAMFRGAAARIRALSDAPGEGEP